MYKFMIFIALTSFLGSCKPKDLPTVVKVTPDEIVVKFSHMSTMEDLAQAAMLCAQNNVNFQYAGTEFFDDGRLRKVAIQVTTPTGQSGQTTADITKLQYGYYGFMYSSSGYFKIGEID